MQSIILAVIFLTLSGTDKPVLCPVSAPGLCQPLQTRDCHDDVGGQACTPLAIRVDQTPSGMPQLTAELCGCTSDDGSCGPLEILGDPGAEDLLLSCERNCSHDSECQIVLSGFPVGVVQISALDVPDGAVVRCECISLDMCPLPTIGAPDPCTDLQLSDCQGPITRGWCYPICAHYDPTTGSTIPVECDCREQNDCHIDIRPFAPPGCVGNCPPGTQCTEIITDTPDLSGIEVCCTCLPPAGACCFDDDNDGIREQCQMVQPEDCEALGGIFDGPGSTCGTVGACCFAGGEGPADTCQIMYEACCAHLDGTLGGPGSNCLLSGACCLDEDGDGRVEQCAQISEDCCEILGGEYHGTNSQCTEIGVCCRDTCLEDLDSDGLVGPADLAALLGAWGPCPEISCCPADINGSGIIEPSDIAQLLGAWGPCN